MKRSPFKLTAIFCAAVLLTACATPESQQNSTVSAETVATSTQQAAPLVERVTLAEGLYQVAFSARHNTVYVAAAGNFEEGSPPSAIYFLDPQTLAVKGHLPLERKAFALTLDDAADRLRRRQCCGQLDYRYRHREKDRTEHRPTGQKSETHRPERQRDGAVHPLSARAGFGQKTQSPLCPRPVVPGQRFIRHQPGHNESGKRNPWLRLRSPRRGA